MYGHIAFIDRKWSLIQNTHPKNKSTCYKNLVNEMSTENKTIFNIMTLDGHNHPEKNKSRPSGIITFKYILHALTISYEK